jgi:hypothetical protein
MIGRIASVGSAVWVEVLGQSLFHVRFGDSSRRVGGPDAGQPLTQRPGVLVNLERRTPRRPGSLGASR